MTNPIKKGSDNLCGVAQDMAAQDLREQVTTGSAAMKRKENGLCLEPQPSQGPCVNHSPVAFSHATSASSPLPPLPP